MIDTERAKHLKEQWEKRDDTSRDQLLARLLQLAWPTLQSQKH